MAITIRAFVVAMENYGAKRMPDIRSPKSHRIVPAFKVGEFEFLHSGSAYVFPYMRKIPKEIMDRAMQEYGDGLLFKQEVHFIEEMLTLASMIDDKYSKDFVDGMINETYKKLLVEMDIHSNPEFPFQNADSAKMEELCKLLAEYSKVVNPFGSEMKLKEPIDYIDSIDLTFCDENENSLLLYTRLVLAIFAKDKNGWVYNSTCSILKNDRNGKLTVTHYYDNRDDDENPGDEIVLFLYEANEESQDEQPKDFSLEISLKTGLAWENYDEEKAKPITDKQIEMMIDCLKISIEEIQQNIVRYMVSDN